MSAIIENPQNVELSQCVKTIYEFGSSTYQNICTGASETVHWGALDWVGVLILVGIGLAFLMSMLAFAYNVLTDW